MNPTLMARGVVGLGKRGQTTFRAPTLWRTGVWGAKCRLSPFSRFCPKQLEIPLVEDDDGDVN